MTTQKTVFAITAKMEIKETTVDGMLKFKTPAVHVCETYEEADRWVGVQYLLNS